MRFLCIAMASGVLVFAIVAACVGPLAEFKNETNLSEMRLTLMAVAIALSFSGLAASIAIPIAMRRSHADRKGRSVREGLVTEIRILVAASALIEAPGLFWCVLALIFQDWMFSIGGVIAAALILARFPTSNRLEEHLGANRTELERRLAEEDLEAP